MLRDAIRGSVVAPAGCGKTHLIAQTLASHRAARPILVLTHTNAGVAALRARLARAGAGAGSYRLGTIDGWALRLATNFPLRSGLEPYTELLRDPPRDYPKIRRAALQVLAGEHLDELLASTYARVIIDEYQDCSRVQHEMVARIAVAVPTVVLGDPMQSIFDFGGNVLAKWETEVSHTFPEIATLDTPHRWLNVGQPDLGLWLLEARNALKHGHPIDLNAAPVSVEWVELDRRDDYRRQLKAARARAPVPDGSVLILADSRNPKEQRRFASQIPGAATVEAVDLGDFVRFADSFDFSSKNSLRDALNFADSVLVNVSAADLLERIDVLQRGTARKSATEAERSALQFKRQPTPRALAELLETLNKQPGVRTHRPTVLQACFQALRQCDLASGMSLGNAARRVREDYRAGHRAVARRAVGSTLLLKGLEADMAVILNADQMNARHLYVAMTRGARKLTICSTDSVLTPG